MLACKPCFAFKSAQIFKQSICIYITEVKTDILFIYTIHGFVLFLILAILTFRTNEQEHKNMKI